MGCGGERGHGGTPATTPRTEDGRRGRTSARGGRYFIYRPPLGPCQPLDRARAAQILNDCTLTWLFSCLAPLDDMDRVIERADRGAAAEQAATALLDAAGTLSAGFWAPAAVSFSPPVDVAEEVEQSRVLGARRVAACPDAGGGTGREK